MATKLRKAKRKRHRLADGAADVGEQQDFAIVEQNVGAPSRRRGSGEAPDRQAEGRAAQADLRRQSPQSERLRRRAALLRQISRPRHGRRDQRLGARPCHQDDPALRSGCGVEAALSRRRISDDLRAQRLDQRRVRRRRRGDHASKARAGCSRRRSSTRCWIIRDDCELLEIILPAEFDTVELE